MSSSVPLLRPCLPPRAAPGSAVQRSAVPGSPVVSTAPRSASQDFVRIHPMDASVYVHHARDSVRPGQVRLDHRPPPQPPSSSQTTSSTRSPPLNPVITLDQKRDGPRHLNLYVDTPRNTGLPPRHSTGVFNGLSTSSTSNSHHPTTTHHTTVVSSQPVSSSVISSSAVSPVTSSSSSSRTREESSSIIEEQPSGLKKEHDDKEAVTSTQQRHLHTNSIICSKCGKCKCKACTHPEPSSKDCTPSKVIECCSCLYCVRCTFYHCFKDSETNDDMCSADDPCACCERPHCLKRWTCMGIMSVCLPCLCLYWPLKGLVTSCTALHHRCSRKGCSCRKDKVPSINKHLLIPESESSST